MKTIYQRMMAKRNRKSFRLRLERLEHRVPLAADLGVELFLFPSEVEDLSSENFGLEPQSALFADVAGGPSFADPTLSFNEIGNFERSFFTGETPFAGPGFFAEASSSVDSPLFAEEDFFAGQDLWGDTNLFGEWEGFPDTPFSAALDLEDQSDLFLRDEWEADFTDWSFDQVADDLVSVGGFSDPAAAFNGFDLFSDVVSELPLESFEIVPSTVSVIELPVIEVSDFDSLTQSIRDDAYAIPSTDGFADFTNEGFVELLLHSHALEIPPSEEALLTIAHSRVSPDDLPGLRLASEGEELSRVEPIEVFDPLSTLTSTLADHGGESGINSVINVAADFGSDASLLEPSLLAVEVSSNQPSSSEAASPVESLTGPRSTSLVRTTDALRLANNRLPSRTPIANRKAPARFLMTDGLRDFGTKIIHRRMDADNLSFHGRSFSQLAYPSEEWRSTRKQARIGISIVETAVSNATEGEGQLYVGGPISRLHGIEVFDIFSELLVEQPALVIVPPQHPVQVSSVLPSRPVTMAAVLLGLGAYATRVYVNQRPLNLRATHRNEHSRFMWGYLTSCSLDDVLENTRPSIAKLSP